MRARVWAVVIALVASFTTPVEATVLITPALQDALLMKEVLTKCHDAGLDMTSLSWPDIRRQPEVSSDDLNTFLEPRFKLLGTRGPSTPDRGQAVAVSSGPITYKWSFHRERTVIWFHHAKFNITRDEERDVADLFTSAGLLLPEEKEWKQPNVALLKLSWRHAHYPILAALALAWAFLKIVELHSRRKDANQRRTNDGQPRYWR